MPVRVPRLPGIRFEVVAPPPTDILPRMDVAAFVGFAASGPRHVPVAVEDVAQFSAVFGDDLTLAWDPLSGDDVRAYLAPAVRAFFRNGGRRCWVIRVAGDAAVSNEFPIPGLVLRRGDGSLVLAVARARSEGSWSDGLRVGAAVVGDPVVLVDLGGDFRTVRVVAERPALSAGDLLRIDFDDAGVGMFFGVGSVSTATPTAGSSRRAIATLSGSSQLWFRTRWPDATLDVPTSATLFSGADGRDVATLGWSASGEVEPTVTLDLAIPLDEAPDLGTLVRVMLSGGDEVWLTAETARELPGAGSPIGGAIRITGRGLRRVLGPPASPLAPLPVARRLSFEIRTRLGDDPVVRLGDLAFGGSHTFAWSALPTDESLFVDEPTAADRAHSDLRDLAATPRFPLAGPGAIEGQFFLPVAMPIAAEPIVGPLPVAATALERDGLDRFDATLFLDPDLIDAGVETLMTRADDLRYRNAAPRRLRGIHATLGIEEATIVAVPDAVQRGWTLRDVGEPPPAVPSSPLERPEWWHFLACDPPPEIPRVVGPRWENFLDCGLRVLPPPRFRPIRNELRGTYSLLWTSVVEGGTFVVEESSDPAFQDAEVIFQGPDTLLTVYGRSPGDYYYRVRVEAGGTSSDWSEGLAERVAAAGRWRVNPPPTDPNGPAPWLDVQRALLRLCAARGDLFAVLTLPGSDREEDAIAHADALRSPFDVGLGSMVRPIGFGESRALSHGAIVHPWLYVGEEGDPQSLRLIPPDGAACGVTAARALARGAWVAPANEPMRGVVALLPALDRGRRLDLQEARVNLVRDEPGGFVTLDASTLSDDDDLRPINVRRLLALARRLALRLGPDYAFEPHDDILRGLVRKGFESALRVMFERGAFAGATPSDSYRVDVDAGAGAATDADAGRLVVELRLAPSQPLTFLTVRLVQQGDRSLVAEVR
jgi:hypothetical protein